MIKIQDAGNGYRVRISCDEIGEEASRTSSFNKKSSLWKESDKWLENNPILPQFTPEEISAKEQESTKNAQLAINAQAREFLSEGGQPNQTGTGWKLSRHEEQLKRGVPTSMTEEEINELLDQRQQARDSVIDV